MSRVISARCEALVSVIERECFSDEEFAEVMREVPEAPMQERYVALAGVANALFPSEEADGLGGRLRAELLRGVREALVTGAVGDLASTVAKIDVQAVRHRRLQAVSDGVEAEAPVQREDDDAGEASRAAVAFTEIIANYPQGEQGVALAEAMLKDLSAAVEALLGEAEKRAGRPVSVSAIREIGASQRALAEAITAIADNRERASAKAGEVVR